MGKRRHHRGNVISCVTNGGKTTLAKNLQKHLPNCSIICQDDFFKPESEIETDKNGFLQYDVLEALNMEKMMSAISSWKENARCSVVSTNRESAEEIPILIIEGFLLFNYKPLDTIWNRSYFLTIPYEECKRRRSFLRVLIVQGSMSLQTLRDTLMAMCGPCI
nr:nicotinamide riboside kinase 1 isoform X5 [Aotus nancymaae]